MSTHSSPRTRLSCGPRHERGVVLFVALIAMVVMSLAGIALLRSVDTSTSVAGNLAFRQASIAPINNAVEKAANALFYAKTIGNTFNHDAANNYYANLQPGESASGIPSVLQGNAPLVLPGGFQTASDAAGNTVSWVIERVCANGYTGDPLDPGIDYCDLLFPKVSPGKNIMEDQGLPVNPVPLYRVTVRVDGPASTVTFAQAMLR
jgi:type IV pilus assembly protein PilX